MIFTFWISLLLIVYTFVGYGFLLFFLVKIKKIVKKPFSFNLSAELPTVTIVIAAYNEENIIDEKIKNTFELDYPKEKLQIIFITDGSSDNTPEKIEQYSSILLLHENSRAGKMAA